MKFMDILRRIKDMWVETLIVILLLILLYFAILGSPWVGVAFLVFMTGLFGWYYVTAWKDEL